MANKTPLPQRWVQRLNELPELFNSSSAPERQLLISDLLGNLNEYLDESLVDEIYEAYLFGAVAHEGQKRNSGEAYIYHPLAVAGILAEMRLDSRTIIAAILHDVVEDTYVKLSTIEEQFGADIAHLVDGVSKISQLEEQSKEHAEAASFRKMFMAMARDIRVIIIKLADRLHNMRTLDTLPVKKKQRISKQTLEIYAPIANRLGMRDLTISLEDLSFKNLYPNRYDAIEKKIRQGKRGRKPVINELCTAIQSELDSHSIKANTSGREKNLYSIYRKMRRKRQHLRDLQDLYAIRVITEKDEECYTTLGIIHNLYKPRPAGFKDYIAIPKVNGYQSLHTVVFGPFGQPVEIQIRSQRMHRLAESGVASHWLYKSDTDGGDSSPQQLAQKWLDSFLETQQKGSDSGEYLEHLKADLFPDEVYVFTPKGDIKRLPRGATALDFAYSVHSKIGDHCIGAKINQIMVPLHETLRNGDHIEIITSRSARPLPAWLDYAMTAKSRSSIRHYLSHQKTRESLKLGKKLFKNALKDQGYKRIRIHSKDKVKLLEQLKLKDWNDLLTDIGFGKRLATLVAKQFILAVSGESTQPEKNKSVLTIEGTERLLVNYANCCHPIPDDKIIGTMTSEHGLVVHRSKCKNIKHLTKHPDKYFHLQWSEDTQGNFQVKINMDVRNEPGVLATLSNIIAEQKSNINNVSVEERHDNISNMTFIIEVQHRKHLADIMKQLHADPSVVKLSRDNLP